MTKPEINEPVAPDPIDEYDPEFIRQLLAKREGSEGMDLPSCEEEFLEMIKNKSFSNET